MREVEVLGDHVLLALEDREWYVHSIFEHTFNLTDKQHTPLVILTSDRSKLLPGGLYLPPRDFTDLLSQVRDTRRVEFHDGAFYLETYQDAWKLEITETFRADLLTEGIRSDRLGYLLNNCRNIDRQTGFDQPFQDFLTMETSPYQKETSWLTNAVTVQWGVDFFIGRGRGLTPSGDDFLLGWILIDWLSGNHQELRAAIASRIETGNYTTDVGRSYLYYALRRRFSSALLGIVRYLKGNEPLENLDNLLAQAIDYGNTSGIDCLAGIVSALVYKQVNLDLDLKY